MMYQGNKVFLWRQLWCGPSIIFLHIERFLVRGLHINNWWYNVFLFITIGSSFHWITSTEITEKTPFVGRVERDDTSSLSLGKELYNMMSKYDNIVFDF